MNGYICPKCQKDDRIQKVSGTTDPRLRFPPQPICPYPTGWRWKPAVLEDWIAYFFMFGGIALALFFPFYDQLKKVPLGEYACFCFFFGPVLIGAAFGMAAKIKIDRKVAEWENTVLQDWKQNKAKWMTLYYCARDDIVFYPHEGTSAPADNWIEYILL